MKDTEFLALVQGQGAGTFDGRFRWVTTKKPAARYAKVGTDDYVDLTTATVATVRHGIEFGHMAVNDGRVTGPLPWGEWIVKPYLIGHKGKKYGRLYVLDGTARTTYYVNGAEVDRETFAGYLTPSAARDLLAGKHGLGGIITVSLDNLYTRASVTA